VYDQSTRASHLLVFPKKNQANSNTISLAWEVSQIQGQQVHWTGVFILPAQTMPSLEGKYFKLILLVDLHSLIPLFKDDLMTPERWSCSEKTKNTSLAISRGPLVFPGFNWIYVKQRNVSTTLGRRPGHWLSNHSAQQKLLPAKCSFWRLTY